MALFDDGGKTYSVGRGAESPAGHRRAHWVRQTPGENEVTLPLASAGTSRDQLLTRARRHGLEVENVGRRRMRVDGKDVSTAHLEEGALLEIEGQFLLRCVKRVPRMEPRRHFPESLVRPFGQPNGLGMVCQDPEMWLFLDRLAFAAKLGVHVLILGETGTGKEATAHALHAMGSSPRGPFVAASAANLAPSVLEDELFGHREGYPEPRMPFKKGLIGEAHGGTLFLDEIGNLPPDKQGALLRVLDEGEYRQLGADGPRVSTFRLVGAMNRLAEVLQLDLRKRMSYVLWTLPLRARRGDVPLLVRHLLNGLHASKPELTEHLVTKQSDGSSAVVPPAWFIEKLLRQENYEGNVRDLESAVNGLLERGTRRAPPATDAGVGVKAGPDGETKRPGADEARGASLTKEEVEWFLAKAEGNVSAAAKDAGVSRAAFYRAMDRVGIERGSQR